MNAPVRYHACHCVTTGHTRDQKRHVPKFTYLDLIPKAMAFGGKAFEKGFGPESGASWRSEGPASLRVHSDTP